MIWLLFSTTSLGFSHSIKKVLINCGIELIRRRKLYVLLRLLEQLPFFISSYKSDSIIKTSKIKYLVYLYPIWLTIFRRISSHESIPLEKSQKSVPSFLEFIRNSKFDSKLTRRPEIESVELSLSGFLITHWLSLYFKLKKMELSTRHNFFVFVALIILFPCLLFYFDSPKVSILNSSFFLLRESVVGTPKLMFFFHKKVSSNLVFGAALIAFYIIISSQRFFVKSKFKSSLPYLFFCFLFFSTNSSAQELYLVEMSPLNSQEYTVSNELISIDKSSLLALEKTKKLFPTCKVELKKVFNQSTEDGLFKFLSSIGKNKEVIVVGLSRSTFARIGAVALKDKPKAYGLSIGASSALLKSLNKNFFSITSPLRVQLESVKHHTKKLLCHKVMGIYDRKDPLSSEYYYEATKHFKEMEFTNDEGFINSSLLKMRPEDCLFIALNFSKAQKILPEILQASRVNHIYGTGDWSIHSSELTNLLVSLKNKSSKHIHTPTGWTKSFSSNSRDFYRLMQARFNIIPNPIDAYTYDAVLMSVNSICTRVGITKALSSARIKKHLLKKYYSILDSNNFLSEMTILTFGGKYGQAVQ